MNKFFKIVLLVGFLGCITAAQESSAPGVRSPAPEPQKATPAPTSPSTQSSTQSQSPAADAGKHVAAGSVIPVFLSKTVDAKKAKTGDEVVAKIAQDMKANTGEVILAKDTKVMGHVTSAQAHTKEQKESQLTIAFDRAVMKDGSEMQMPMSIQAVIASQNDQNTAAPGNPGNDAGYPPSAGGTNPNAGASGRTGGIAGSTPPSQPSPASGNDVTGASASDRPPITNQTEGVIGIKDLKLVAPAQGTARGSVLTAADSNVKIESGTMLLLKVSQ